MKQKVVLQQKVNTNLPKSLQDEKTHNFTIYYCLKDVNRSFNVKPLIVFTKKKDSRLKNVKIVEIEQLLNKKYNHSVNYLIINCTSQEFLVFKHYFEQGIKKFIIGKTEDTQKNIEFYAY